MKSIILTDSQYDLVMKARRELLFKGTNSVPGITVDRFTRGEIVAVGCKLILKELK